MAAKYKGGDLAALRNIVKEKYAKLLFLAPAGKYLKKAWEGLVPMHYIGILICESAMLALNIKTKKNSGRYSIISSNLKF